MDPTERERTGSTSGLGFAPLGDIASDLFRNLLSLVRDEIRMASAEMSQKAARAGKSSTMLTVGGFVAYAGFLFVMLAAAFGLSVLLGPGWAFLIVGGVALIIGAVLVSLGKRRLRADILPNETLDTAREDTKWIRNQLT